jgi:deoxyribodipyrimidine photo-lyase
VLTASGAVSRVFTPFYRRWSDTPWDAWPEVGEAVLADDPADGLPALDADPPMPGGAAAAERRLSGFLERADRYLDDHDRLDVVGTSLLSADLRFGTLSPRHVAEVVGRSSPGRTGFVRQLAWRDWWAHLLLDHPGMVHGAQRPEYDAVAWRRGAEADRDFAAWCDGRTGYPVVDAAMRELRATGWMHNRARMIVGSFLVKDLLIDWRRGERWFRHWLTDGDVPQNVGNWQWVAGTGPDAAPYFRIFNPVSQSRKFDPHGTAIRTWVPELAGLDDRTIHAPWEAGPLDLAAAGVVLGDTYPAPIVDHAAARTRTLAAYADAKASAG